MVSIHVLGLFLLFGKQTLAQDGQGVVVVPLERRDDPLQYFMKFQVGEQTMKGLLDTGSADLLIFQQGSDICKLDLQQCDNSTTKNFVTGAFDPTKEQGSIQQVGEKLNASFGNGAEIQGEFIKAPFRFSPGSQSVNLQMGLGMTGKLPTPKQPIIPIIGVGPVQGESAATKNPNNTHPNIPAQLKNDGIIKSNVFGLSLAGLDRNDDQDQDGDISPNSPGATGNRSEPHTVRTNQPSGQAGGDRSGCVPGMNYKRRITPSHPAGFKRSVIPPRASYSNYCSSIKCRQNENEQDGNILSDELPPIILIDSGAPGAFLPPQTVQAIADGLGTTINQQNRTLNAVACNQLLGKAINFSMGNDSVQVEVPLELIMTPHTVMSLGNSSNEQSQNSDGMCKLPIFVTDPATPFSILGAPIMQMMYIIHDKETEALHIARAKMGQTQSDIREFVSPNDVESIQNGLSSVGSEGSAGGLG
ncbi:eukaryotic aspartyl protease [Hirsutella rhossiliensis]|uniref:Eukaryotic aspartyl protease domain-containing protein n=1 Tax=Hirsutella rhossiliensis TaxID=111463 RepID=A0A9P8SGF4_9HYPO|nr:eukaryotic aspartyl protease domain-containing protein [Hirsutella rhossiliensis]KAH0961983.1 eukaryotic aspartyl protease domain-containing protein [Hirsutella rhossiliensis]